MLFSINEDGDIEYDENYKSFCTEIFGDPETTIKKNIRTIILTYFVHKNFLNEKFILNERNHFTDLEIKEKISELLEEAFKFNKDLIKFIEFMFINEKSNLELIFYSVINNKKELLLMKTVKI